MPRKTTPTLAKAADEFIQTRSSYLAATTLANETSVIRTFVRGVGVERQCHHVTSRQVELWFASEAKRQQASSFNKVLSRVRGFLDFCRRRGWIDLDLLGEVRRLRVLQRDRKQLSPAALLDLPNHAACARDRMLIIVAANTALRASSITGIRIGDVDLASGLMRVTIHKSSIQDQLPITTELDVALREWLHEYAQDAGPLEADWYLVPRREPGHGGVHDEKGQWVGGREMRTVGSLIPDKPMRNPAEVVQRALRAQGHQIDKGEGVHTLRRSVARAFFDARTAEGYDAALRSTAALLHHSSSQTTEKYLGLSSERLGRDRAMRGRPFLSAMVSEERAAPIPSRTELRAVRTERPNSQETAS
jgi:integrase